MCLQMTIAVWLVNVSKWQCACKEDIEIQVTDDNSLNYGEDNRDRLL